MTTKQFDLIQAIAIIESGMIQSAGTGDENFRTLYDASDYLRKQAKLSENQLRMILLAAREAWQTGRRQYRYEMRSF